MYDRHKPIIKWYEYDATKLYRNADADDVMPEEGAETTSQMAADAGQGAGVEAAAAENTGSVTGDPSMDDEVARIMAAFSGAKQNSVDDVFAAMAAEEAAAGNAKAAPDDNEALISSICAPKQNNVDDLVAMARG